MRVGKILDKYEISMDTLVSFLTEKGVPLPDAITQKTKIPNSLNGQLYRRFGGNDADKNTSKDPESMYLMAWRSDLPSINQDVLHLIESSPTSKRFRRSYDLLVSVLERTKAYCDQHPDLIPDANSVIGSLKMDVRVAIQCLDKSDQQRALKFKLLSGLKLLYNETLNSFEGDKIVMEHDIPWSEVEFQDGGLIIDANSENRLFIPFPASKKVFNLFSAAFDDRIPPLHILVHSKNPIEIVETPELDEVFRFLSIQNEIKLGSFFKHKELFDFLIHSKTDFHQSFLPKDKTPFIQFLVEKQAADYRYVPMFETGGEEEDSFLFTIRGASVLYIVWESLRPNTATYVFPVDYSNYEKLLQALYDYACSDIEYKRRRIHHGVIDALHGVKGVIVNHLDFQQWRTELDTLFV